MATRGRKSSASLAVQNKPDIGIAKRLSPTATMSDAEMSVWVEVVNDQPAGAFIETHAPLLEMYCRHVVNNRIIAGELVNLDQAWLAADEGLKRYDTLLRIAERESRAASLFSDKITNNTASYRRPSCYCRAGNR